MKREQFIKQYIIHSRRSTLSSSRGATGRDVAISIANLEIATSACLRYATTRLPRNDADSLLVREF